MDKKIEQAIQPLLSMYSEIEMELLIKIASHFSMNDKFLNSDYWRIKKMEEMGLFNQEIIDFIARYTGKTKSEILRALKQIGIDVVNIDHLNRLFEDEVLNVDPQILINNYVIENMINTAYNELSNHLIEMSSKIEESTREAYLNIVEKAYLKTTMGTHSYQEAIKEAINDLSNDGITVLTYTTTDEKGNIVGIRNYDIEGTARREILTGARQLSNNINMQIANDLQCEYIYLSEHLECREQHFDWQGTIIKRTDLVPVTDYGSITGLGGINCRHYFEPYYGDARGNDLKQYSKEDSMKAYKVSQRQRYIERGIRNWKRKAEMFKANEDMESYNKCKVKVKQWQSKAKRNAANNSIKRDYSREQIADMKTAMPIIEKEDNQVIVIKDKPKYLDKTKEWLKKATPNSHEIIDLDNYIADDGKKYKVDGKNVVLDYSQEERNVAEWLKNTFGGEIKMVPRVNNPDNIKTPDFIWNNEKWDLKTINGSGKRVIEDAIKKKRKQADNFIFDITPSKIEKDNLFDQLHKIYNSKTTDWVNKIIVKQNDDVIVIYEKK